MLSLFFLRFLVFPPANPDNFLWVLFPMNFLEQIVVSGQHVFVNLQLEGVMCRRDV